MFYATSFPGLSPSYPKEVKRRDPGNEVVFYVFRELESVFLVFAFDL